MVVVCPTAAASRINFFLTRNATKKPFVSSPSNPSHRIKQSAWHFVNPPTSCPLLGQCSKHVGAIISQSFPSFDFVTSRKAVAITISFSLSCIEHVEYTICVTFGNDMACFNATNWKLDNDCILLTSLLLLLLLLSSSLVVAVLSSIQRSGEFTIPLPEQLGSSIMDRTLLNFGSVGSAFRKSPWMGSTTTLVLLLLSLDEDGMSCFIRSLRVVNRVDDRSNANIVDFGVILVLPFFFFFCLRCRVSSSSPLMMMELLWTSAARWDVLFPGAEHASI